MNPPSAASPMTIPTTPLSVDDKDLPGYQALDAGVYLFEYPGIQDVPD